MQVLRKERVMMQLGRKTMRRHLGASDPAPGLLDYGAW